MPKVRFLKTCTVLDGTGTTFEEGKVYELTETACARWERRNAAERVTGEKVKTSKPIIVEDKGPEVTDYSANIKKIEGPDLPVRDPDRARILERTSGE